MLADKKQKTAPLQLEAIKELFEKNQWLDFEANRALLEPRASLTSVLLRLAMVLGLILHTPYLWIALWLTLSVASNAWMSHLISEYGKQLLKHPKAMTQSMVLIAHRYKQFWIINSAIWGFAAALYINWVPHDNQVFCMCIMLALAAMSITRTHSHRKLMHQVSAMLIGSQILFAALYLITRTFDEHAVKYTNTDYHYIFIGSLLLVSYFIWGIGNRMNNLYKKQLNSEYFKLELIEKLSKANHEQHIDQQALIAADQEIQSFYSAAAHDLRQPVYAMEIYVDMMLNEPQSAEHYFPKIKQSCESINSMFNSLFDFQKIHALDMSSGLRDISITDIFGNLKHHYSPIAESKNLTLRFKPIDGSVNMVPMYLIRILSNLITNAIRYTQAGGVLVGVRRYGQLISFEVWDTGIGINKHLKEEIFEEFFKVNNPLSADEGFGIGLSIVKQLISQIKGADIIVESKLGKGSVFKFQVPFQFYSAA
jgi:signal transduction histidine kinase